MKAKKLDVTWKFEKSKNVVILKFVRCAKISEFQKSIYKSIFESKSYQRIF